LKIVAPGKSSKEDATRGYPLLPYHSPYAASGIFHISFIPWDYMDMNMEYGLTGSVIHIYAYIEAIRLKLLL
jgi:hypothetical protein